LKLVWTYTLYAIHIYLSEGWKQEYRSGVIKINDFFKNFLINTLWVKNNILWVSDEDKLYTHLKILEGQNFLKIHNDAIIITEDQAKAIQEFSHSMKENDLRKNILLVDVYLKRIEKAFVEEP
jgi:hypothetical protein